MQKYIHLSGRWSGIAGGDHSSSLGECEDLLEDANCLLFNGTERFLSYFSSNKISSVNLNGFYFNFYYFLSIYSINISLLRLQTFTCE